MTRFSCPGVAMPPAKAKANSPTAALRPPEEESDAPSAPAATGAGRRGRPPSPPGEEAWGEGGAGAMLRRLPYAPPAWARGLKAPGERYQLGVRAGRSSARKARGVC